MTFPPKLKVVFPDCLRSGRDPGRCACGGVKESMEIVCKTCWHRVPGRSKKHLGERAGVASGARVKILRIAESRKREKAKDENLSRYPTKGIRYHGINSD